MQTFTRATLVFCALTLAFNDVAVSQTGSIPSMVSFQGRLTDETDVPVDATLPIQFSIYRGPVAAMSVWSELQSVAIADGIFNVLLGSETPLPDSIFSGQLLYLGIKVDTDPEMAPRQPLVSIPYAFLSGQSMCVPAPWYTDSDNDGFGTAGVDTTMSCTKPDFYAPNADDCDDGDATVSPGAEEICDPPFIDHDCDGNIDSGVDTDDDNEDDLCDLDDDNDGVLDVDDLCPLVPGPEENDGCPL